MWARCNRGKKIGKRSFDKALACEVNNYLKENEQNILNTIALRKKIEERLKIGEMCSITIAEARESNKYENMVNDVSQLVFSFSEIFITADTEAFLEAAWYYFHENKTAAIPIYLYVEE